MVAKNKLYFFRNIFFWNLLLYTISDICIACIHNQDKFQMQYKMIVQYVDKLSKCLFLKIQFEMKICLAEFSPFQALYDLMQE